MILKLHLAAPAVSPEAPGRLWLDAPLCDPPAMAAPAAARASVGRSTGLGASQRGRGRIRAERLPGPVASRPEQPGVTLQSKHFLRRTGDQSLHLRIFHGHYVMGRCHAQGTREPGAALARRQGKKLLEGKRPPRWRRVGRRGRRIHRGTQALPVPAGHRRRRRVLGRRTGGGGWALASG